MHSEAEQRARTVGEAKLDAFYHARLHELHARLYRRLRYAVVILSLLAGSSAFAAAMASHGLLAGVSGFVVALLTFVDIAVDFAGKGLAHTSQRKRYLELIRSNPAQLDAYDKQLAKIAEDDPGEIESLRVPAYNDNVRSNGHESWARAEGFWQRMARIAA